jgi:hypothetical protein
LTSFDVQQAIVRDGHPVGITADVVQHLLGAGKGRLRVDNPFLLSQRRQVAKKLAAIAEVLQGGEELGLLGRRDGVVEGPISLERELVEKAQGCDDGFPLVPSSGDLWW